MSADVIVIGAGPAGLAAAAEAARRGLQVMLLDEQPAPGGQIYRALTRNTTAGADEPGILGKDYWRGRSLIEAIEGTDIEYVPGATVWTAETDPLTVGYLVEDRTFLRAARFLIIATGAYERPVPIPGWTLPGVMTAGAAQILMKAEGAVLGGRIVLAGSGPLLQLVTCQLLKSGADVAGLLETTATQDYLAAARHLPRALGARDLLLKGLDMRRTIKASGIPVHKGVKNLRCDGKNALESISFESGGKPHRIEADLVLLHEGVVPHVQISRLLNLSHEWFEAQRYWRPVLDDWGETSASGIFVAGDGAGIDGARAAEASGRIAALQVVARLGALSKEDCDREAAAAFTQKKKEQRIRPLLDHLYSPPSHIVCPEDPSTIVCRCEEVRVREIHACMETGCGGPNQLKAYSRCGMGPCQGRMCGLTVSELMAKHRGVTPDDVGYYRIRAPIKPIPLSALAALEA
ncbi:MAG: NAD(P)/FAD-dependent oxidoreductase, partial [Hyphomicrobiaceae bacterium]|nr:NAD(P)/FAD-dependent oxidoreductase [Hyphomicrobiaceae bacterium]